MENIQFKRSHLAPINMPASYRAKWPVGLLGEGFLPFAKTFLRSMSKILTGPEGIEDLAMLLAIIDYQRPVMQWYPSLGLLAFTAGMTEAEADTVMRRLAEKNLISYEPIFTDRLKINLSGLYEAIDRLTSHDRQDVKDHNYDE